MAIVDGDVYFTRVTQSYLGQTIINTFWHVLTASNAMPISGDIIADIRSDFWTPLSAVMVNEWKVDRVECMNWRVPAEDFDTNEADIVGGDSDSGIPSFLSLVMRSPKGAPGQRYSYTRLTGFGESKIDGNTVLADTNMLAALAWRGSILFLTNGTMYPVQVQSVGRPDLGVGNPSVNRSILGDWTWQSGTQRSRIPGVGI